MIDIIKKSLFTGLGLACLTKEKLEELSRDIITKGNLSEKEGKEFLAELMVKSNDARNRLESQVRDTLHETLGKMDLATKDDVEALERKISELAAVIKQQDQGQ